MVDRRLVRASPAHPCRPPLGNAALADGARPRRAKTVLGLGGVFTLFVAGFALALRAWWSLLMFWGLTLNRRRGPDRHHGRPIAVERLVD